MKYTIIAKILDGVIAANKNNIICFRENSLRDKNGEDSLYHSDDGVYIGQTLTEKMHRGADFYWWYSRKEWDKMNKSFEKLKK